MDRPSFTWLPHTHTPSLECRYHLTCTPSAWGGVFLTTTPVPWRLLPSPLPCRCPVLPWIAPSRRSSSARRATRKGKEKETTPLSVTSSTRLSSYPKVAHPHSRRFISRSSLQWVRQKYERVRRLPFALSPGPCSHTVQKLTLQDVSAITVKTLKVIPDRIIDNYSKRQQPRFRCVRELCGCLQLGETPNAFNCETLNVDITFSLYRRKLLWVYKQA